MNTRTVVDLLRDLDDPAAHAAAPGGLERQLGEAQRRAAENPPVEVEPAAARLGSPRRRLVATLLTAAVLVAATVSVAAVVVDRHPATRAGSANTATLGGRSDALPTVEQVTSTQTVLADQRDSLAPLEPADLATLDIGQIIAAVRAHDPEAGQYLNDPATLHVREGLYSNPGLLGTDHKPTVDVPAYAISGGHATCTLGPGKYSETAAPATSGPCTAVLVVDARTGTLLLIAEES